MSYFPRDLSAEAAGPPAVVWEEPACLLCGRRHWRQVVEAPDASAGRAGLWFAVVECQECGLCFTNPRPDRASIAQFYPPTYAPFHRRQRRQRWRPRWSLGWHLPGKSPRELPWPGPGRLLDFGCGRGSFLERMRGSGWEVTGIDISPAAVNTLRSRGTIPAILGSLPHADLMPMSFDVVTMWHSLEHVHDPLGVLREARRLLVPGGRLVVAVPNIESLPFRWFRRAWVGLDLPRHLTHFTPLTLYRTLNHAGFKVGPIRMIRHSHWLRASSRLARQRFGYRSWRRWIGYRAWSRVATWYCFLANRADCMLVTAERPVE